MADRGTARVWIRGEQDITLLDVPVEVLQEVGDRETELSNDHPPLGITDQRKLVVLLPDAWRKGGAEEHFVHLVTSVA